MVHIFSFNPFQRLSGFCFALKIKGFFTTKSRSYEGLQEAFNHRMHREHRVFKSPLKHFMYSSGDSILGSIISGDKLKFSYPKQYKFSIFKSLIKKINQKIENHLSSLSLNWNLENKSFCFPKTLYHLERIVSW